tara:strand:+ start:61325 stop:62029 length:705 start_codon:yes stop_codon:yes gene_type:complete
MIAALHQQLHNANSNEAVRAIVITANGPVFSSGHDLKEMSGRRAGVEPDTEMRVRDVLDACAEMMLALVASPKPIIAAVQGVASAAGCQLVSMCDLALASEDVRFCTPGVNIGTFCTTPLVGIGRNMHRKHAMEMALTGDLFSAEDAVRFGLINRTVPLDQLHSEVEALAQRIAAKSSVGIAKGKAAFYAQIEQPIREAYRDAGCAMLDAMTTQECEEGVDAFLGKRQPQWQGL